MKDFYNWSNDCTLPAEILTENRHVWDVKHFEFQLPRKVMMPRGNEWPVSGRGRNNMVRRQAINSLEPRQFGWQKVGKWSFYLPSPEQIREECEVIQARWSRRERVWRRIRTPDLPAARRKAKPVIMSESAI